MKRIALATCARLPEPDHDQAPLLEALRARGVEPSMLAWDDAQADPGRFAACVVRSTWNYIHDLEGFLAWLERAAAATRLLNPLDVLRWNCDKSYLRDLERRGASVVPTVFADRGKPAPAWPWDDVVIKPRIGAGSFATARFPDRAAAGRFLASACAQRDMMIQPYVRSVDGYGERALVWIAGELTHAVRKSPRFIGADEAVAPVEIAADERAFAQRILAPLKDRLLYARVDAARADDGSLTLMELELVEPSLFLKQSPAALERFADAVAAL